MTSREEDFSHIFGQLGLTREVSAAAARRVVFSAALSEAIYDIVGRWLDDVVRIFTDVALETETNLDQVRRARKGTARRRWRTEAPKS
jgi:hypothetical protein